MEKIVKLNKRSIVLKYYPDALVTNVGCKSGDYFHVADGIFTLGQGKSKKQAWAAAYNQLEY